MFHLNHPLSVKSASRECSSEFWPCTYAICQSMPFNLTFRYFKTLMIKVSLHMKAFSKKNNIFSENPHIAHVHQGFISFCLLFFISVLLIIGRAWTCTQKKKHIESPQMREQQKDTGTFLKLLSFLKCRQVELRLGLVQCHLRADTVHPWEMAENRLKEFVGDWLSEIMRWMIVLWKDLWWYFC